MTHYNKSEANTSKSDGDKKPKFGYLDFLPTKFTPDLVKGAYRPKPLLPGIASHEPGLIAAEPGIGKSALGLTMCAAVASGKMLAGFKPTHMDGRRALFVSLEETTSEIVLRAQAIAERYGADYKGRLHFVGKSNARFAQGGTVDSFVEHGEKELAAIIDYLNADLVIIDPLSHFPIGDENNTTHAAFFAALGRICETLCTTILVIHHVRKPPSGFSVKPSMFDVRGSSTSIGVVRSLLIMYRQRDCVSLTYEKVQYGMKPKDQHFAYSSELIKTDKGEYETLVMTEHEGFALNAHQVGEYRKHLIDLFDERDYYRQSMNSADWVGFALAIKANLDIGKETSSNKTRSAQQNKNRAEMKLIIDCLLSLDFLKQDYQKGILNNRSNNATAVFVPGDLLYDK